MFIYLFLNNIKSYYTVGYSLNIYFVLIPPRLNDLLSINCVDELDQITQPIFPNHQFPHIFLSFSCHRIFVYRLSYFTC
jgi:hypothetical protein